MILLSIDTSGPACSAALLADDRLLGEIVINSALTHSETIMPAVDELLSRENLTCADVDLFAVAAGPGSFTGVRIGVCAAKGMAHAAGKPCARVNSLAALAAGLPFVPGVVCPILDARCEQVYCAAYRWMGAALPEKILPDAALPLTELLKALPENEIITFTGDGAAVHEARIRALLGERARFAPPHARVLRASSAAYWARLDSSCHMEARLLTPIYLRAPQAERERSEKATRAKL